MEFIIKYNFLDVKVKFSGGSRRGVQKITLLRVLAYVALYAKETFLNDIMFHLASLDNRTVLE